MADPADGGAGAAEEGVVLYETRGPVAIISINRPDRANAQNDEMTYALDDRFRLAAQDDEIAVIVLRSAGKHFSSGHDIGSRNNYAASPADRVTLWYDSVGKQGGERTYSREQEVYLGMCRRWREIPKPTVAAVRGACIAGGLMLAWVCDIIVASEDAVFSDPVVAMGVPGVEYFAHPFEMQPRIAREFLMLGERMSAQRAYEVGMINRLVPGHRLDETVMEIAERLSQRPRFALALTKQAMNLADDIMGKRSVMESTFALHHLAHAHNQLVSDSGALNRNVDSVKKLMD